jgi:beta-ribofuranosylaminobenzene 5'-phosphate synthase
MEVAGTTAWLGADEASGPCERVAVATSARLHFGFLDPSGRGERPFGSFGLAIDRPQTRLSLTRASEPALTGVDCARAEPYLRAVAAQFGKGTYHLHLDEVIPAHAGLGSGTQLALAIGAGVATLEGLKLDLHDIAAKLDRGKRSGIGIGTFGQGGAVLDGGPGKASLPPILSALAFPREWRVLLIFDPDTKGLYGDKEIEAFAELPDFPPSETAELCRRVLLDALPAIAEHEFRTFCDAVGYMQRCMGAYFGPLQGGPYVSKGVAEIVDWLARAGITGIGQSSWGPTGFVFAASQGEAERLLEAAVKRAQGSSLKFEIARARNRSASIERSMPNS